MIAQGTRVAIVDDHQLKADTTADVVDDAGLASIVFSQELGHFESVDELLERIQARECTAVVCDHRLDATSFAQFTGAEFVSSLYREKIPAVLLSDFLKSGADDHIRLYRADIPFVMDRDDLDPDAIQQGLDFCARELEGRLTPERRPWRTLLRVVDVLMDRSLPVVDAILHNWDPDNAVRFPLALIKDPTIANELRASFSGELRLFAQVNVGCQDRSELFFRDFELAPIPNVADLAT